MGYSENVNPTFSYVQIQNQMETSSMSAKTMIFFLSISISKLICKNLPTTCMASFLQLLHAGGDEELLCSAESISTQLSYWKWWNTWLKCFKTVKYHHCWF